MNVADKPRSRVASRLRFLVYLILLAVAFLIGGFLAFAHHVQGQKVPDGVPSADGIVVWTGKGGGRLRSAGDLLVQNHGERLLVSGVNTALTLENVTELMELDPTFADRVDLDYQAANTAGNARETASWANALGYEHIILVTSAYHMPRAEIEITSVAGRMRITPYPVAAPDEANWWSDGPTFRRLMQEYGKLMLTYVKLSGNRKQRGTPVIDGLNETP